MPRGRPRTVNLGPQHERFAEMDHRELAERPRGEKLQERHHVLVYQEDWEFLSDLVAANPKLSLSLLIRQIIHVKVKELRKQLNKELSEKSEAQQVTDGEIK